MNAFRSSRAPWGLGSPFAPVFVPLVAQLDGVMNLDGNKVPQIISAFGLVLCVLGYGDYAAQVEAMPTQHRKTGGTGTQSAGTTAASPFASVR